MLDRDDHLALRMIAQSWAMRAHDIRCDADVSFWRFRIALDMMTVSAIVRCRYRQIFAGFVNDVIHFLMLATQAANLLLLVMVVAGLAEPWPMMQAALATGVMLTVGLDLLWTFKLMDKVLGL